MKDNTFYSSGKHIPVLSYGIGSDRYYIELRIFDEDGYRCGAHYTTIDREDAKRLASNILEWLKDTEHQRVSE